MVSVERGSAGFALLLVLWALTILSVIGLTLAASAGTEIRASQDLWSDLQAERLAQSGHEFATYLESRVIGSRSEDLSGLPVEPLVPGLSYRIKLNPGTIDLLLEGENGKFDPSSPDQDFAEAFFSKWTGDRDHGRRIAASLFDWIDPDDEPRPLGAESESYSAKGYLPRNSALGSADLPLINGLSIDDIGPLINEMNGKPSARPGLHGLLATVPTGAAVNPNYAPGAVLEGVPGITSELVDFILQTRQHSIFTDIKDFQERAKLQDGSPVLNYLRFDRGAAPSVLSIARLYDSPRIRADRRVRTIRTLRPGSPPIVSLVSVERDVRPE